MICVYGNLSCLRFGDLVLKRLVKCYSVLDVNERSQDDESSILVYEFVVIPCGYRYVIITEFYCNDASNSNHDDCHEIDVVIQPRVISNFDQKFFFSSKVFLAKVFNIAKNHLKS